jgi:hypothetical protein
MTARVSGYCALVILAAISGVDAGSRMAHGVSPTAVGSQPRRET